MARERAPGGGRKPRGPLKGKSRMLTTRITSEIRAALEDAARESGTSLSQEVELRLRDSLKREHKRPPDVLALAEAIAQVIEKIQQRTGKQWREDAWTGQAVRRGIDFLVGHFAAFGEAVTPPSVEKAAEKAAEEAAARGLPVIEGEADRSPAGVGEIEAAKVITMIEHFRGWPEAQLRHVVWSKELYRYLQLLHDLGSGAERLETYIPMERRR